MNKHSNVNVERPLIRLHSDKNISEFKSKLNNINWDPVLIAVMSTMDIIIFRVRLQNATTAVSSLLNSLAKDQRIRNG